MEKRETTKDVEIAGRRWRIGKFDALTGSYIAYKLMVQMLPMGLNEQIGITPNKGGLVMGKEEFKELQTDCLRVCSELTQVGNAEAPLPVLMANGVWGVEGLDTDVMTVLMLTIHALIFNVSGFFGESALKDLAAGMQGLSPFSVQTSTGSVSDQ
jgi:hypothetical protein